MNAIQRAVKTGSTVLPVEVWKRAHREYPAAVGKARLYCAAFFGHGRPAGVRETTASVWRGTVRKALQEYVAERGKA